MWLNALTPKRLELLQDVHRKPASSVKALAERLGRDYQRVREDVETLTASGLLQREGGRVRSCSV
jgi:predicted transcriptional regulator